MVVQPSCRTALYQDSKMLTHHVLEMLKRRTRFGIMTWTQSA